MKAYIHISDGFEAEVDVKNHPNYGSEIIIGGQRLTIYGVKRKDISIISIFPGVKTWARVKTDDSTLVGIIQRSNLGTVLVLVLTPE